MILILLACSESGLKDVWELEVLTYNVHGLPSVVTGDDTTARVEKIASILESYELIGLQEDFIEENHEIFQQSLEHPTQTWFSKTLEDRFYGSGLSLFSLLKLVELHEQHYTSCFGTVDHSSDCLASKGFVRARLELSAGIEIDVYNTHLEAGGASQDTEVKAQQIAELVSELQQGSEGRSVIVMGDTNLQISKSDELELLNQLKEEGQLVDCCDQLQCAQPQFIDRIFFRGSSDLQVTPEYWSEQSEFVDEQGFPLSDHPAISCGLTFSLNGQ